MNRAEKSITVGVPVAEAYKVWSNFETFPRFIENVEEVRKVSGDLYHWKVKGPMGANVEYDAHATNMIPNQRIGWNTKAESPVKTSGEVTFSELGPNQTKVHVILQWDAPAGPVGDAVAKIFQNPEGQLDEALKNFKNLVEGRPEETARTPGADQPRRT